ncbi:FGGY family carbohydrate kinase [Aureimonas sp. ME7]|uniref:rhamnulokinase n=1 Tax=Aureimonas sp. ME7 TaxID=2744252 RepID=UPI0015F66440|nr:FGGY family carbohydrate kinase [Aureimonas sp. ME7]
MQGPSSPSPRCLVLDLGGGSGRAMLAEWGEDGLSLSELHRFSGYETRLPDGPAWDLDRLLKGIEEGLGAAARAGGVASVGVDSWGVDFALLDETGRPVDQPRTHRHRRGARGLEALRTHHEAIAERTGAQILPFVTVFHLADWARRHPDLAAKAQHFLMIADLVAYRLSGTPACERSLARTSGLVDFRTGAWSPKILALAGMPSQPFVPLVAAGTRLGSLKPEIAERFGLGEAAVVAVAAHDTASAALALAPQDDEAFLVAGSWNIFGIEVPDGPIDAPARRAGFGLEGGVEGRALLVKSFAGLLLLRALRDQWAAATGEDIGFAEWGRLALASPAPAGVPDLSAPAFLDPVDLVGALRAADPDLSPGQPGPWARALYEGMALQIAGGIAAAERLRGAPIRAIRLGGGGARDETLCALIAHATGRPVLAGPVEASAAGNALVQFASLGLFPDITAARAAFRARTPLRRYEPTRGLEAA